MGNFTIKLSEMVDLGEKVFIDDDTKYPIFDEIYRAELNRKIQDHYWNYEIGQETTGMFRFALNRKLNEIMPYYNQLYESQKIAIDPLSTVNLDNESTTHGTEENNANSNSTSASNTSSQSRSVASELPQTHLAGNEDYATAANDSVGDTTVSGTGTGVTAQTATSDATVSHKVTGSQGHSAALLMQYRKSFLNIDMNVIRDLESLFMAVWDSGDSFTQHEGVWNGYPYFGIGYI